MLFVAELASLLYISLAVAILRRVYPKYNERIRAVLGGGERKGATSERSVLRSSWFLVGVLALCIALVILESLRPYYFAQDDVHRGELPVMLFACRTFWLGHLPQYNPYLLMGAPMGNVGYYSLTYPPTYLAYAIARHLLHNEYALCDVFAAMHLIAGYIGTYLLARKLSIGPMPSVLAALSFVLSGSILMIGRSWHTFMPLAVYLPLMALGALTLVQRPLSWRLTFGTALVIGLFFQVGFSQVWIYAIALFCLLVVLFCLQERQHIHAALKALPALLVGFGLSAPLAFQQFLMTRGVSRPFGYGSGIIHGVFAMFLPYPLVKADHPDNWGMEGRVKMGCLFFFGGLFAFLLLIYAILLLSSRPTQRLWRAQPMFVCAAITFAFAATNPGPWSLLVKIPLLGKINDYPLRLLPFFVLFAVLCGGAFLERLLQQVPSTAPRKRWEVGIGAIAVVVLLYYVHLAPPAFSSFNYAPYPELPAAISQRLQPSNPSGIERAASWTQRFTPEISACFALNCNVASVYEVPAFNGYDPIVDGRPEFTGALKRLRQDPILAARAYGLEWHLEEGSTNRSAKAPVRYEAKMEPFPFRLPLAATASNTDVLQLSDVDPLAFPAFDRTHHLPIRMHGEGLDVDVTGVGKSSPVVVNFLWYTDMRAQVDGVAVGCSPDAWGRMLISVPDGAKMLTIRYKPPWGRGLLLGAAITLMGIGCWALGVQSWALGVSNTAAV